jgi:23S rRNA (uracil1939-C5)-methyltransferase
MKRSFRPQPARASVVVEAPPPPRALDCEVSEVGAQGDGAVLVEGQQVFVPQTLPGERVRVMVAGAQGRLEAVLAPSPERVTPACALFGRCGGCALQHWADAPTLAWKRAQIETALRRRGLETDIAATVAAWGSGRRRATLHARREGKRLRIGFMRRGTHAIEEPAACLVLHPALERALPGTRRLAELLTPPDGRLAALHLTLTESGLDVDVKGAGKGRVGDPRGLMRLAETADALDLARLSVEGEPLVTRRTPWLAMGRARVEPPPGAFLQATREGEETLVRLVLAAIGSGSGRVADLFAGLGTFALRLADRGPTLAVEGDAALVPAMKKAADAAGGPMGSLEVQRRDLFRSPLGPLELKRVEAVVFDPPRAGARNQAEQLARSQVPLIVGVSCDPATFARDARILVDGGWRLERVTPVDQFRHSPHVELVGVFRR